MPHSYKVNQNSVSSRICQIISNPVFSYKLVIYNTQFTECCPNIHQTCVWYWERENRNHWKPDHWKGSCLFGRTHKLITNYDATYRLAECLNWILQIHTMLCSSLKLLLPLLSLPLPHPPLFTSTHCPPPPIHTPLHFSTNIVVRKKDLFVKQSTLDVPLWFQWLIWHSPFSANCTKYNLLCSFGLVMWAGM